MCRFTTRLFNSPSLPGLEQFRGQVAGHDAGAGLGERLGDGVGDAAADLALRTERVDDPADVVDRTRAKYVEAYERLTGTTF